MINITTLKCPYCKIPMKWNWGKQIFSYWTCKKCNKNFEYNVLLEQFTGEE